MRIEWNRNPLKTHIFLDDQEKEIFKLKMKIESLEEELYHVYFKIRDDRLIGDGKINKSPLYDPKEAVRSLEAWVKHNDKDEESEYFKEVFQMYMDDLEVHSHMGDCTCFAASCSKCHAEGLIGIDTIKGLGKHSSYKIDAAFKDDNTTIAQALDHLRVPYSKDMEGYKPWWDDHMDRWDKERLDAIKWLEQYRDDHFPDDR